MAAAKRDVSATGTRWLRPAVRRPITLTRLMEASEHRLYGAAHSSFPLEELVATRILDNPKDFTRWESEHSVLMIRVADERRNPAQAGALLAGALSLVHRKALFEYLREAQIQIRGQARHYLFRHLLGEHDYARAVVLEHGNYLRSAASFLCSRHVGRKVMLHPLFAQPLARYEELYAEYFRIYCELALAEHREASVADLRPMLAPLKREVSAYRGALLRLVQRKITAPIEPSH